MTPSYTSDTPRPRFNDLRRGATYRATTRLGTTTGEYLGMETPHGVRAMLLRHQAGTASIPFRTVTALCRAAA